MQFSITTKGYSLIEVLVAIAVLMLSIVGPLSIASKSLQTSYYAREQATALFLAQEGIEIFTTARNDAVIAAFKAGDPSGSWDDFYDPIDGTCLDVSDGGSGDGCNMDFSGAVEDCSTIENCVLYFEPSRELPYALDAGGSAEESKYTRVIKIDKDSAINAVKITSEVSWGTILFGGTSNSVVLTAALYSLYE